MSSWGFSPFPDCSICKRWADDGGWLDNVNYRFWVCLDCDDFLDDIERQKHHDCLECEKFFLIVKGWNSEYCSKECRDKYFNRMDKKPKS